MVGTRTAVIGAGVVGAAVADELSARGWHDTNVVDQRDLPATGGPISHAPGTALTQSSQAMATQRPHS